MKINVKELKNLLMKATLNNVIESVQFNFSGDKVSSSMISPNRDAIVMLDTNNEAVEGIKDDITMNFMNPNKELVPFLNVLDENSVDIKVSDDKMVIINGKQKMNIHFCSAQVVSAFTGNMDDSIKPFHSMELTDEFVEAFNKIKKVGSKFDNVLFAIEDGVLYLELRDVKNKFSNAMKIEAGNGIKKDVVISFNYKNFMNLMSIIVGEENYTINLYYVEKQKAGLMKVESENGEETYVLMSLIDDSPV